MPEHNCDDHKEGIAKELSSVLNRYSAESVSGTPDFILASYMLDCLKAFNAAVVHRSEWRSEPVDAIFEIKEN